MNEIILDEERWPFIEVSPRRCCGLAQNAVLFAEQKMISIFGSEKLFSPFFSSSIPAFHFFRLASEFVESLVVTIKLVRVNTKSNVRSPPLS